MKLKTPSKNPFKLASWTLMLIAASFISSPLMAQSEVAASHNQRAHATRPMSAKCKKKVRKALKLPLLCTGRSQPSEGTASNSGANQGNVKAKCVNRSNETQQPAPGSAIAKCLSRSNDAQSQPAQKNAPANATPKCVDRSSPSQNAQKPQAQPKGLIAKGNRSDSVTDENKVSLHTIDGVYVKDKSLEIESKAGFSFSDTDAKTIVATWAKGSQIRIYPNNKWSGGSYEYLIKNVTPGDHQGETVLANLTRGPLELSPYNRRIGQLKTSTGEVSLQYVLKINATPVVYTDYYEIGDSSAERAMMAKWQPNDIIIVGDNNPGVIFSPYYNLILINIATDSYVSAKRITK